MKSGRLLKVGRMSDLCKIGEALPSVVIARSQQATKQSRYFANQRDRHAPFGRSR